MRNFYKAPKNYNLLKTAKCLRRVMTTQEKHLWYDFLQKYPIKIYKQRIIGNYIVDFYCSFVGLVIEIDGSQHRTSRGMASDSVRDEYFQSLGLQVMRFSNFEIDHCFIDVCEKIDRFIQENIDKKT